MSESRNCATQEGFPKSDPCDHAVLNIGRISNAHCASFLLTARITNVLLGGVTSEGRENSICEHFWHTVPARGIPMIPTMNCRSTKNVPRRSNRSTTRSSVQRPSLYRSLHESGYPTENLSDRSLPTTSGRVTPPLSTVRVPHCGYHYDGTHRRFFEGWYWKVSGFS